MRKFLSPPPAAPLPRTTGSIGLLQFRRSLASQARRVGTLELALPGSWPLEDSRFPASKWSQAPEFRGLAALYLAADGVRSVSSFKDWWSKEVVYRPGGPGNAKKVTRSKASKAARIQELRAELICELKVLWCAEDSALMSHAGLLPDEDGVVPLIQGALESAARTTDEKHKKLLDQLVPAVESALRVAREAAAPLSVSQLDDLVSKSEQMHRRSASTGESFA
jgi:hypothetical protein